MAAVGVRVIGLGLRGSGFFLGLTLKLQKMKNLTARPKPTHEVFGLFRNPFQTKLEK